MFLAKAYQIDHRVKQEAKTLSEANYHVFVLAWDRNREFGREETLDGIKVRSFSHIRLDGFSTIGLALGALVFQVQLIIESVRLIAELKQRPVIHAHDFNTLVPGCILRMLRLARVLVYDAHELTYAAYEEVYGRLTGCIIRTVEQLCLRHAGAIITVSPPFAKYFRRFNDSLEMVQNCPDANDLPRLSKLKIRQQLGLPLNAFIVSYVGTVRYDCNLDLLLSVASLQADKEIHFVVVGDGPQAQEFRQNALRTKAPLTVLPRVPRRTALAYVSASDLTWGIYRAGSLNMRLTLPWKFFESLACQVPFLVEEGFLTAQMTRRFGCGIVVSNENPRVVLEAILSVARDQALHQKLSSAAKGAAQNFKWQLTSQNLVSLYGRLRKVRS
jgi:glycosyltransferase involved in cell wall biosynthesis